MPNDTEVREALAAAIGTVDGLRSHAFTPGQVNPPAAVVIQVGIEFDQAMMRGHERMLPTVRLLTGGDLRYAQLELSRLIYQIRDVLWDDPTLGGVVSDCRLMSKRGNSEGQIDVGGAALTVVDLEVEVIT